MVRSMSPASLLGRRAHLRILRLTALGACLALDDDAIADEVLLLPIAELPAGVTTVPAQVGRLITLLIARETLVPFRWGAWALLGRRLELTGTGAQERLARLGLSVDPPPDAATLDREIEAARHGLQPFLPFIRSALRC